MENKGLTKGEQLALTGLAGLIFLGMLLRLGSSAGSSGDVWIEAGPAWEPISRISDEDSPSRTKAPLPAEAAQTRSSNAPTAAPKASAYPPGGAADLAPDKSTRVNLNLADARTLETLPGIGKVKAQAIIDYRRVSGPFTTITALDEVPGIGPKTIENLRPYVQALGPHSYPPAQPQKAPAFSAAGDVAKRSPNASPGRSPGQALDKVQAPGRGKIDINKADYDKLMEIPGIGPVLAGRIIEHREGYPFRKPSDLVKIKGIGPTSFESMEPYVRTSP